MGLILAVKIYFEGAKTIKDVLDTVKALNKRARAVGQLCGE